MSVIMSMCMSFAMTAINVGFNEQFAPAFLSGWGIGFIVSLPLSFFLPPSIQKIMQKYHI
jgi:hypothetical protein